MHRQQHRCDRRCTLLPNKEPGRCHALWDAGRQVRGMYYPVLYKLYVPLLKNILQYPHTSLYQ